MVSKKRKIKMNTSAILSIVKWIIFGGALLWTGCWIQQMISYSFHAYHDREYQVQPFFIIMVAVFWSVFAILTTIGG
jgi:hypothetical protein